MSDSTIDFEKDAVKAYLDRCIRHWRNRDEHFAPYYVDCYQSVRVSIFGELLGENEDADGE